MITAFKNLISEKAAGYFLLILMAAAVVLHVLIMAHVVPYSIAWGGRLESDEQMYLFESISIGLIAIMAWLVAVRIQLISGKFPALLMQWIFGAMALLFLVNTIGNLLAISDMETLLFTPLTALACLACTRLAIW